MDFAGNQSQDGINVDFVLPDPTYNMWVMGMEVTQGIQDHVPTSTESRASQAPQELRSGAAPLVANKRTVVRVFPAVEDTSNPVAGATATLRCFQFLGATLGSSEPCDGPLSAELTNPDVTVDPANGNDLETLRRNPNLTWNFLLPEEWTEPGGPRWLTADVQAPSGHPECGSFASGCDGGANLFLVETRFREGAPLIVQPIFVCVRRAEADPKEVCDTLASNPTDAMEVAQSFLWGKDWDNDGKLDPFTNVTLPVADGPEGIEIRTPTDHRLPLRR